MKKVLIISYFFPPLGGAGIQRTLKFVKYLPQFGWLPLVLTQKNGHHYAYDYGQLKLISKDVKVIRANSLEAVKLRFAIRRFLKKIVTLTGKFSQDGNNPNDQEVSISKGVYPLNLLRRFIEQWIFIPDSKIRWFPTAIFAGLKLTKNREIDILYSTSYPYTCHLIGYFLKMITKKPWVADFRDPWADNIFMTKNFSPLRKRIDKWLESRVIQKADVVVLTTRPIGEQFVKKYPFEDSKKFKVIPNGYDEGDFQKVKAKKPVKFTIVFTGALTPSSSPGQFFEALFQISCDRPDVISDFKVLLVGWMDPIFGRRINELGIEHLIEVVKYVPRRRCLQIMAEASILLLPLSKAWEGKGIFTGKIFDYLSARKPILALLPEGIAAELIRQTESGVVVDPENKEAIVDAILTFYAKYKNNTLSLEKRALPVEFSRKHLTKTLAQVFDSLSIHGNQA